MNLRAWNASAVVSLVVVPIVAGLVMSPRADDRIDAIRAELAVSSAAISEANVSLEEAKSANQRATRILDSIGIPVDPPVDPPVRPPVDPPVDPPRGRMSCEELRSLVVDVDRSRWTVLEPPSPSFGRILSSVTTDPDQVWGDMVWRGGYEACLVLYGNHPGDDVVGHVRQRFLAEPRAIVPGVWIRDGYGDQFGKMKWAFRTYRQRGGRLLYGHGNGGWTREHGPATSEHFAYDSPNGSMEYGWLVVEHWGGQAIQVASRPPAGPGNGLPHNDAFAGGETIWVHDVCFHENGTHSRRASFPLSLAFNNQADGPDDAHLANLILERFHIRAVFEPGDRDQQGNQLHAFGAVLCAGGEQVGWRYGDVAIRDGTIELRDSDRTPLKLGNCRTIVVERIEWILEGGNRKIDLEPWKGGQASKGPRGDFSGEILWRGSTMEGAESLQIRVRGETIGTGDEDILIRHGVRISLLGPARAEPSIPGFLFVGPIPVPAAA